MNKVNYNWIAVCNFTTKLKADVNGRQVLCSDEVAIRKLGQHNGDRQVGTLE